MNGESEGLDCAGSVWRPKEDVGVCETKAAGECRGGVSAGVVDAGVSSDEAASDDMKCDEEEE